LFASIIFVFRLIEPYTITRAYRGETFFQSPEFRLSDQISIRLIPPVNLTSLLIVSGVASINQSQIVGATVELKLVGGGGGLSQNGFKSLPDDFLQVATFDSNGKVEVKFDSSLGKVEQVRVQSQQTISQTVTIKEIHLVTPE
jgi:hypothetical protein